MVIVLATLKDRLNSVDAATTSPQRGEVFFFRISFVFLQLFCSLLYVLFFLLDIFLETRFEPATAGSGV